MKRSELVDAAFLVVLGTLALSEFRDTYHGSAYLVAGVLGLLFGTGLAELSRRLQQPPVILMALVVVVYFLLGGAVSLHSLGGTNVLPVPHTLSQLADSSVHGWKDLLTTLPPVANGPLLALPYLLGLIVGSTGTALARRFPQPAVPVLVPVALLGIVILLGVKDLHRTTITGAVFAAVSITWLVARERNSRGWVVSGAGRRRIRQVTAAGLCLATTALGLAAGPHLPGLRHDRVVLRSSVVPPFNVGHYPSPLASFRRYTSGYKIARPDDELYDKPLFRVTGLPAKTPIRIAALDSYNGIVWGAGNVAASASEPQTSAVDSDTFQRVGQVIDNPSHGRHVHGDVKILDGNQGPGSSPLNVWLPTAGSLTGISFDHPSEGIGSADFRYNLGTSTGVLPSGLDQGVTYRFDATLTDTHLGSHTRLASGGLSSVDYGTFQQLATTWAGKGSNPQAQVDAIAAYLKTNGHYTDGELNYANYLSGQSLYRLKFFTSSAGQLAGDDEQFAAMMALAANAVGVPARVVVGAVPERAGIVEGKDVHAWVELQAGDGSWRTLSQSAFMSLRKPEQLHQQDEQSVAASTIPPPAPLHPPASAGQPLDDSLNHKARATNGHEHRIWGFILPLLKDVLLPVLLIGLLCGAIVGAKRWRRTRRRTRGAPSQRLAYAWQDVLECARDHGIRVRPRTTRREQAAAMSAAGLGHLNLTGHARRADTLMFGRNEPDEEAVSAYWDEIDAFRREVAASRTRQQRIKAALNPGTLRPSRPRLWSPARVRLAPRAQGVAHT